MEVQQTSRQHHLPLVPYTTGFAHQMTPNMAQSTNNISRSQCSHITVTIMTTDTSAAVQCNAFPKSITFRAHPLPEAAQTSKLN